MIVILRESSASQVATQRRVKSRRKREGEIEMKNYGVRCANHIENTGLDCQVFADREEAERAAEMVRSIYGATDDEVSVCETPDEVTTTFAAWDAAGW